MGGNLPTFNLQLLRGYCVDCLDIPALPEKFSVAKVVIRYALLTGLVESGRSPTVNRRPLCKHHFESGA